MGEPRQLYGPHRFVQRFATRHGIDFPLLMKLVESYESLHRREQERWRCEGCLRRVQDFNRVEEEVRPYIVDEDGLHFCDECADRWDDDLPAAATDQEGG